MTSYKNSQGYWVLVPKDDYILYNSKTGLYTNKLISVKGVTMTDWEEVPSGMIVKTDEELLTEYQSDINSHVTIKRDTKADTDTKVEYTFKYTMTGGCVITETFS